MSEADKGVKFFAGGAGVDGLGGEMDAVAEISSTASGDKRGGGVGENDVAVRRVFAIEERAAENLVNDFSVLFGVAA